MQRNKVKESFTSDTLLIIDFVMVSTRLLMMGSQRILYKIFILLNLIDCTFPTLFFIPKTDLTFTSNHKNYNFEFDIVKQ